MRLALAFVLALLCAALSPHRLAQWLVASSHRLVAMFSTAYAVFNFLGILFILLPAGWHWSARNTATLLFIFWCLVNIVPAAINSVVWYERVDIKAPVYCDVRDRSPRSSPTPR